VLVPSRYETFGYVAAEALSAGAHVVGSDVSGLRDVIGETGTLVPLQSPCERWLELVRASYLRWQHERDTFERDRAARRARAVARFNFEDIASQFDDLLSRACRTD
jgi:glycosyltransferase involved in cell wall biosynthesis